jgi:RimJ/RimL family protein N-acetyltransferase
LPLIVTVLLEWPRRLSPLPWWGALPAPDPAEAAAVGARGGEIGIDYAIGDRAHIGRGAGTALIATLVTEIRRRHPGAGILSTPEAANTASRRVLEKNGFLLIAVRPVITEPSDAPMAIYRLPPAAAVH